MKSLFFILFFLNFTFSINAQPVPVELIQNEEGNWQLLRGGEPFQIKGAGGSGSKELLAESGGNTFRIWGVDSDLREELDLAHKLGLTVVVGHWLGHERHGFDYDNSEMVAEQFERVKRDVIAYKDHPALLIWALGNEMEGFAEGENPKIWNHVQELAVMVKELDPFHPIMTVTAEIGGGRVPSINSIAKDVDIHGVNSYGGLPSLVQRYKQIGGIKPIIITEFGPPGTWEVGTTSFGAPYELTSTQKAEVYKTAYQNGCLANSDLCLGGFAFTWGFKMEATATWFGMFLPTGEKLAAVDVMTEIWSGEKPENLSPSIERFELIGPEMVSSGDEIKIELEVTDPNDDELSVEWIALGEASEYFTGGDAQAVPLELDGVIDESSLNGATLTAPEPGIYRIYVAIRDGKGAAAVANVPFMVNEELSKNDVEPSQASLKLPVKVYADNAPQPWVPTGWMGNTEKLELDMESTDSPHTGRTVIEVNYKAFDNWVGVAWQNPLNDWGDLPGGYNLTGAEKLTFWARGKKGGEKISFAVGILKDDREYYDTAFGELKDVKLSDKWKKYTINLKGKDLSRIKTPFVWTLGSPGLPVSFYLDDIQFE